MTNTRAAATLGEPRNIGDRIRARREALGLSLSEAAGRAGMRARAQWHDLESDKVGDPRASTLLRVASALGCSVDELLR
jgi:transcriptional regulator with XRE-family HTH domain